MPRGEEISQPIPRPVFALPRNTPRRTIARRQGARARAASFRVGGVNRANAVAAQRSGFVGVGVLGAPAQLPLSPPQVVGADPRAESCCFFAQY